MFRLTFLGFLLCALALAVPALAPAQTAAGPNEGAALASDPVFPGAFTFSWWGRSGRTYFLQHSDDLNVWSELPIVEPGTDQPIQWGFTSSAPRFFLRLRHSDSAADTNTNGIPDDWEMQYYGDLSHSASEVNASGVTNLVAYLQGRNPTKPSLSDTNGAVNLNVFTPLR